MSNPTMMPRENSSTTGQSSTLRVLAALALVLTCARPASAAVAVVRAYEGHVDAATTVTISVNASSATMLLGCATGTHRVDNTTVLVATTGVQFNGSENFTTISGALVSTADVGWIECRRLVSPTSTTANVVFTTNVSDSTVAFVIVFSGVDTTTPIGSVDSIFTAGASGGITNDSALTGGTTDDLFIGYLGIRYDMTGQAAGSGNSAVDVSGGSGANPGVTAAVNTTGYAIQRPGETGSVTFGPTWTGNEDAHYIALTVKASGGGGGGTAPTGSILLLGVGK